MARFVTYSPARTVVPTYECFNRCTYCTFRVDAPAAKTQLARVKEDLDAAVEDGVTEILILSGEVHPESKRRGNWFRHIHQICSEALRRGLLPHTNVGPLNLEEMATLKEVNVSMGLMLEQTTPKLLKSVHKYAPSKDPELRIEQLRMAGRLRIPFTTGLLLGIGESEEDWAETLEVVKNVQQEFQHIQECIVQPFSLGEERPVPRLSPRLRPFALENLPSAVALARSILPESVTIQVPPNLVQQSGVSTLLACLDAGARDLGGIGPKDEVNPMYPFPTIREIDAAITKRGWTLTKRLPLYPRYDSWLATPALQNAVRSHRSSAR